jgi:hypothetical protein
VKTLRAVLVLVAATPTWAAYQYYLTDNLTSVNAANWTASGTAASVAQGLGGGATGGALISRVPIPDGTAEAEVRVTLQLTASGGTYTEFLQASPDATAAGTGGGTYLSFEMQNPQFDATGHCLANFALLESRGGATTVLGSVQHPCRNGMVLRFAVHGGLALVWPDEALPMEFAVSTPGVGQPGIGIAGAPAGNTISEVQLGAIDRAPPPAINAQQVGVSTFRNHVDVQWPPVAEPANGVGLASYFIYRDGNYLMRTTAATFSDETVAASQSHTYAIYAEDQHANFSPPVTFTAATPVPQRSTGAPPTPPGGKPLPPPPPANPPGVERLAANLRPRQVIAGTPPADSGNGIDPRRTGVRVLGSYWGGAGEQIDTTSGNVNFSVPLIKAMSRGGGSVQFVLSYNSQMWRYDSAGNWRLGQDVGYGFGWKLQAGSITPIWTNTSTIDHYLYTDATGAEYSLNVNNGNVWTSQEGTYVTYDANAQRLHSTDGGFWVMGSQSSGGEQDAGSLYPTLIEDSNGNQINITYATGLNGSGSNTSARITQIVDARNAGYSYQFYTLSYNSDSIPHLTSISCGNLGTPENYGFNYLESQPLSSPISGASYGTTTLLQSVTVTGLGIGHSFQYSSSGSGEMTQLTTPLGGSLQWAYRTFTYSGGISVREVQTRYLQTLPGAAWWTYSLSHDDSYDAGQAYHWYTQISDQGAGTSKIYYNSSADIYNAPTTMVVPYWYQEFNANGTMPYQKGLTWLYENGNTHLYVEGWTLDPGASYAAGADTYYYRDAYGNPTTTYMYDYGNLNTPARTYNYTYLASSSYISLYIRNRLTQATVTNSSGTLTLVQNTYDAYSGTPPYFTNTATTSPGG